MKVVCTSLRIWHCSRTEVRRPDAVCDILHKVTEVVCISKGLDLLFMTATSKCAARRSTVGLVIALVVWSIHFKRHFGAGYVANHCFLLLNNELHVNEFAWRAVEHPIELGQRHCDHRWLPPPVPDIVCTNVVSVGDGMVRCLVDQSLDLHTWAGFDVKRTQDEYVLPILSLGLFTTGKDISIRVIFALFARKDVFHIPKHLAHGIHNALDLSSFVRIGGRIFPKPCVH
mmetsp:Transcript_57428/g.101935  ORF Transcript_57428/g.101935 Transcript_57428/m.101935 type:complete len:229 (-) Transcript_57428:1152-1838(-)